ncbi:TetR/AcrR family transcriptional regulator [Nocardioides sp. W7]|uniref:TetR/AcrR family transcriptional regulator n=1 Tax=Nocardioides sp. W7 TaxID=2931390 RepID=UPI001FD0DF89|nr:TetR/AcrR family transcriptional regulator [Nocardioides sp. W7]
MAAGADDHDGPRQERRKAATRRRILGAADGLFEERGYAETSIEDIAGAADVAVRTIYLHFSSKAAIMLAYFDEWLDAFVAEIVRRPLTEPVVDTVRAALEAMSEAGWADRVEGASARAHPLVEHLHSGSPDIAGHVMQRWMRTLTQLIDDAAARGGSPDSSLAPHARAVAVFAAWIAALSAAGEHQRGRTLPPEATGNSVGLEILRRITDGNL